jgi:predicted enzyme related to lactoylglutathione lyase
MSAPSVSPSPHGLAEIGQIGINVGDLERAVAFYRDALGIPFLFRTPALAFFDAGGTRLMLSRPERPEHEGAASILYFRVADLPAAHAALGARGVPFLDAPHLIARMPDHELWMAFFHDSEGNTLALMSEVR